MSEETRTHSDTQGPRKTCSDVRLLLNTKCDTRETSNNYMSRINKMQTRKLGRERRKDKEKERQRESSKKKSVWKE